MKTNDAALIARTAGDRAAYVAARAKAHAHDAAAGALALAIDRADLAAAHGAFLAARAKAHADYNTARGAFLAARRKAKANPDAAGPFSYAIDRAALAAARGAFIAARAKAHADYNTARGAFLAARCKAGRARAAAHATDRAAYAAAVATARAEAIASAAAQPFQPMKTNDPTPTPKPTKTPTPQTDAVIAANEDVEALQIALAVLARSLEVTSHNYLLDWAHDHTHLQKLCRELEFSEFEVEGDRFGVPGITDLADLLAAKARTAGREAASAIEAVCKQLTARSAELAQMTASRDAATAACKIHKAWFAEADAKLDAALAEARALTHALKLKLPT